MSSGSNTPPLATGPRLRLKPAGPATGHVDGAWWPETQDLSAELPPLLTAVAARLGRIDRVTYHLGEWPGAPRRISVDDQVVRLEGFRSQATGTLTVIGWDRRLLTLVVVPPETGSETAERVLANAASEDNTDDSAHLLAPRGGRVPQPT
ncbi:DUF5994 family protein [Amycolatopsis sp. NPDC101161]|uniref:DUF5994 family protein n=1 Tax=Amycolatopsis sp. NPDC101161 TaxID=3363940 RepID=UPI00380DEA18